MESDPLEGTSFTTPVTLTALHDYPSSPFPAICTEPPALPPAPTPLPTVPSSSAGSQKRKRGGPASHYFETALADFDKRRAERQAALEAGRERRNQIMEQMMDPCGRYVLQVADLMQTLPPPLLTTFKRKLQQVMYESELELAHLDTSRVECRYIVNGF